MTDAVEVVQVVEIKESDLKLVVNEKQLGHLTTNALQIKKTVEEALKKYSIANYNESNLDVAKKNLAMLNKASKALNDSRIEIEREFMKPFGEFKTVVSDTTKLISECSSKISDFVKKCDLKEAETKKATIFEYWQDKNFSLVSFDKIFEQKWLNKTCKLKDVYSEIDKVIIKVQDDIKTIDAIGEDSEIIKSIYLNDLNLNNAIQYANTLKRNREMAKTFVKPVQTSAPAYAPIQEPAPAPVQEIVPEVIPEVIPEVVLSKGEVPVEPVSSEAPEILERTMVVRGTREQIIALGDFMNANGIDFERL